MNTIELPQIKISKYKVSIDIMVAYWIASHIAAMINNNITVVHTASVDAELYNELAKKINGANGKQTLNIKLKFHHLIQLQWYANRLTTTDPYMEVKQSELMTELHKTINDEVLAQQRKAYRDITV